MEFLKQQKNKYTSKIELKKRIREQNKIIKSLGDEKIIRKAAEGAVKMQREMAGAAKNN